MLALVAPQPVEPVPAAPGPAVEVLSFISPVAVPLVTERVESASARVAVADELVGGHSSLFFRVVCP